MCAGALRCGDLADPVLLTGVNARHQDTRCRMPRVVVLAVADALLAPSNAWRKPLAGRWCTYTADDRRDDEDRVLYLCGRLDKAV
jgi:hypothetical protein